MTDTTTNLKPLVSVIIPAYNCSSHIRQAIESVLQQTHKSIECIVIDDGSTDDTARQACKFGNQIKYVYQENAGVSAARNKGISIANGEFIAFLDADDIWARSKIEIQLAAFQSVPNACLVSTGNTNISDKDEVNIDKLTAYSFDPDTISVCNGFEHIYQAPYLLTSAIMLPANVIREHDGFDETLKTAEDIDLYMRCCWDKPFVKIKQTLVYKLDIADSLGSSPRSYQDHLDVIDRFINNHQDVLEKHKDLVEKVRQDQHIQRIQFLLFFGAGRLARKALRHSVKENMIQHAGGYYLKSYYCLPLALLKGRHRKFDSTHLQLN